MIFTSVAFLVFFPLVLGLYWLALKGKEARLALLLIASIIFYGWWDWRFLGLVGLVTGVNYAAALVAGDARLSAAARNMAMAIGVGASLLVLGFFKYFDFFAESAALLLARLGGRADFTTLEIVLPVGISFYTFQAMSYVIDVRRGDLAAQTRLDRVALYVLFFPQLVAGPIVRAARFFPQMDRDHHWSPRRAALGVRLFILGFIYKALLADNIAPIVDQVYGTGAGAAPLASFDGVSIIGATVAFGAQIYFDFAGYSTMAIGAAALFGYYIPRNFRFPYSALSIAEFWRRWHISLSSWLRDYLYIPLGGNRRGAFATQVNLLATMALGGLWHGAAWRFVVWGVAHGLGLAVHRAVAGQIAALRQSAPDLVRFVGWALTFWFVMALWGPFRAQDWADAQAALHAFVFLGPTEGQSIGWVWLAPLAALAVDHGLGRWRNKPWRAATLPSPVYWGAWGALAAIALALYPLQAAPFVYFQF